MAIKKLSPFFNLHNKERRGYNKGEVWGRIDRTARESRSIATD